MIQWFSSPSGWKFIILLFTPEVKIRVCGSASLYVIASILSGWRQEEELGADQRNSVSFTQNDEHPMHLQATATFSSVLARSQLHLQLLARGVRHQPTRRSLALQSLTRSVPFQPQDRPIRAQSAHRHALLCWHPPVPVDLSLLWEARVDQTGLRRTCR